MFLTKPAYFQKSHKIQDKKVARHGSGYWKDAETQRKFMDELGLKLNIKQLQDWNTVTAQQIYAHGGVTLMNLHNGSPIKLLQSVYPEHEWQVTDRISRVTNGYWNTAANQRKFMDELGKKLDIKQFQDWNKVTAQQIRANERGNSILNMYDGSPIKLLQSVYPEHDWQATNRDVVSQGYWQDISNQRKFMDELGKKLAIQQIQDWNSISVHQILDNGGKSILNMYNGSPIKLLQTVYPDHNWRGTDRARVPTRYWQDISNQKGFMDELAKKLNILHPRDWNMLSRAILRDHGGSSLLVKGSARKLLQRVYPDRDWNSLLKSKTATWKTQRYLHVLLKRAITSHFSIFDYKHPDLAHTQRDLKMEFDIFFPALSLAFEYQGEPHYYDCWIFSSCIKRAQIDQLKKEHAQRQGITLIEIPFWWDRTEGSLAATIQYFRPDIKTTAQLSGKPIPSEAPANIRERILRMKKLKSTGL